MFETTKDFITLITDKELRNAVMKYYIHNERLFTKLPASINHHHSYTGGLDDHTCEVAEIGLAITKILEKDTELDINTDHYIAAAVLHDVGKLDRYYRHVHEWKCIIWQDYAHHEDKPIEEFKEATGVPLPDPVREAILSHMGGWSKTGHYPDDLLSSILHCADLISSTLETEFEANDILTEM